MIIMKIYIMITLIHLVVQLDIFVIIVKKPDKASKSII